MQSDLLVVTRLVDVYFSSCRLFLVYLEKGFGSFKLFIEIEMCSKASDECWNYLIMVECSWGVYLHQKTWTFQTLIENCFSHSFDALQMNLLQLKKIVEERAFRQLCTFLWEPFKKPTSTTSSPLYMSSVVEPVRELSTLSQPTQVQMNDLIRKYLTRFPCRRCENLYLHFHDFIIHLLAFKGSEPNNVGAWQCSAHRKSSLYSYFVMFYHASSFSVICNSVT